MPNLSSYHARWGAILEHPDVARAMLGFGQLNDALDFLQKIEAASKQIGYWRPERLILQSMAWRKKGHKSRVPSSVSKNPRLGEKAALDVINHTQATLHGLLARIRNLNLKLISGEKKGAKG